MADLRRMEESIWYVPLSALSRYLLRLEVQGEIVSCKLLGQTYIIINSERVANALLDQRSNIYSGRPVIQTSTL